MYHFLIWQNIPFQIEKTSLMELEITRFIWWLEVILFGHKLIWHSHRNFSIKTFKIEHYTSNTIELLFFVVWVTAICLLTIADAILTSSFPSAFHIKHHCGGMVKRKSMYSTANTYPLKQLLKRDKRLPLSVMVSSVWIQVQNVEQPP